MILAGKIGFRRNSAQARRDGSPRGQPINRLFAARADGSQCQDLIIPFSYFGGKARMLSRILPLLPAAVDVYWEGFAGSFVCLLNREPARHAEVANDLDGDVVNFFECCRWADSDAIAEFDRVAAFAREAGFLSEAEFARASQSLKKSDAELLQHLIRYTPYARAEYLRSTRQSEEGLPPAERARLFYVRVIMGRASSNLRAKCGRDSGGRASPPRLKRGHATESDFRRALGDTVSHSHSHRLARASGMRRSLGDQRGGGGEAVTAVARADGDVGLPLVYRIADRLRPALIEQRDGLEFIAECLSSRLSGDALLYLDPPYLPSTRIGGGYVEEMSESDHARMLDLIVGAPDNVAVALSGYPSPLYIDALSRAGWHSTAFDIRMIMSHPAKGESGRRTEMLWRNPACVRMAESQKQQRGLDV